jgi:DNA-binding transcriptional regulator YiaG
LQEKFMSTLAIALKDEIRRLARKEIKAQTGRTSRAVAQYRREIARLKRSQRDLEKQIGYLRSQASKGQQAPSRGAELNGDKRFSARSVKAQRRRTGLSAADYAKLIGVSPLTVYNWEQNKTRPRQGQLAALIAVRGLGKREAKTRLAMLGSGSNGAPKRGRPRHAK